MSSTEALEEALSIIEEADDDRIAQVQAEEEAADQLCAALAESDSPPGRHLQEFAGETGYTKTELRELVGNYEGTDGEERPDLRAFLENNLKEIYAARSTDHRTDTAYKWDFGEYVVSTGGGDGQARHFSADKFAKLIAGEGGCYPDTSRYEGRGSLDWRAEVSDFIIGRPVEREFVGPLTTAVNELEDFIGQSPGFGTPEVALERRGIYLPGEESPGVDVGDVPAWEDRDRWIPSQVVMNICDEYEIDAGNEFLLEIDERGLTADWNRGASYETYVDGIRQTFWVLNSETTDPAGFEENPPEPAETVRERIAEEQRSERETEPEPEQGDSSEDDGDDVAEGEPPKPNSVRERATSTTLRDGGTGSGGDDE